MIYFDHAATGGRKPDRVLTAVQGALQVCANPGRSGHKLSVSAAELVFKCRALLSEYFDGYGAEYTVFTKNCTEALNTAILGGIKKGDHVVTTCMEHNSVLRPLEFLRKRGIITYDVCPMLNGTITPIQLARLVTHKTSAVILTSASNVTGKALPLQDLKKVLPDKVRLIVDGAQGGGHLPIRMREYGIDALALAGHKGLYAMQGSGALLLSERFSPRPLTFGGTGSMSISLDMPDFHPDDLEAGTISFPAILSLYEGVQYLIAHEREIQEKIFRLTKYFHRGLSLLPAYKSYSSPNPCGIISFRHHSLQSETVANLLSERYNIAVRGGLHCAPLIHKALKTYSYGGLIRASFAFENSESEIDKLLSALNEIDKMPLQ